jgi:hypothetical protein
VFGSLSDWILTKTLNCVIEHKFIKERRLVLLSKVECRSGVTQSESKADHSNGLTFPSGHAMTLCWSFESNLPASRKALALLH